MLDCLVTTGLILLQIGKVEVEKSFLVSFIVREVSHKSS